ncbi:MAG: ABC transporter ATP-binding protein [Bryobacteraceae bacterium]|nr:ABC transporter ATP-binding protein [Bryobacteraceae bacterium]
MSRSAIVVSGLRKVFRKRKGFLKRQVTEEWALKGVSFEVGEGETYGLLGPNGSGKSTLIRILSTLLVADEGEVTVLGHRLPEGEREVRERIGRVSVDAAFYKKLSARENLLYSAFLYGFDRPTAEARARDILGKLSFPLKRFDDPLEEASRGMQQKVAIARALILRPPLLLLDEPTTGLDPKSKREVQAFIEDLRRDEKTTIFLTTHDMFEAERLCERLGMLAHGKLVAEGAPEDLIAKGGGTGTLEDAFIHLSGEKLSAEEAEAAV